MRIVCVGGGPVGLYFSLLMKLQDPRHEVSVLERAPADADRGWGLTLGHDTLVKLAGCDSASAQDLERAGMLWTKQAVSVGGERILFGGSDIYTFGRKAIVDVLTRHALEAGVRISYGQGVTGTAELPQADLVVVAGGARCRLPAAVGGFGTSARPGSNRYIWLGSSAPLDDFNYIYIPTAHGWIWAYAYQHSAQASTVIVECAAETWAAHHFDTMPVAESAAALSGIFKNHLSGHALIGTLPDGTPASWASFSTVRNEHWYRGNVVLAGDSAHTAHYSLGQGTKMGLDDAIALADSLQSRADLETALTAYETQRKAELERPLSEARCSAQWYENLPRYIGRKPRQFARLQQSRWSPLVRILPPAVSYQLLRSKERFTLLRGVADRIGPTAKVLDGRRKSPPRDDRQMRQSA